MSKQPPPAPTASAVGPCPTIIQIVGRPGTGSLPSTATLGRKCVLFSENKLLSYEKRVRFPSNTIITSGGKPGKKDDVLEVRCLKTDNDDPGPPAPPPPPPTHTPFILHFLIAGVKMYNIEKLLLHHLNNDYRLVIGDSFVMLFISACYCPDAFQNSLVFS